MCEQKTNKKIKQSNICCRFLGLFPSDTAWLIVTKCCVTSLTWLVQAAPQKVPHALLLSRQRKVLASFQALHE